MCVYLQLTAANVVIRDTWKSTSHCIMTLMKRENRLKTVSLLVLRFLAHRPCEFLACRSCEFLACRLCEIDP